MIIHTHYDPTPWVGFDFDGCLCQFPYTGDVAHGPTQPKMLNVLKKFLENGVKVKILTARAADPGTKQTVVDWLKLHDLPALEITDKKDFTMYALFDDRAITVNPITGDVETNPSEVARMLGGISGKE